MRLMTTTLAAGAALALAGCGGPQDQAAERQANMAEAGTQMTAERMQDHADLLNVQANTMTDEAAVTLATDANVLAIQADKTKALVDEAGERAKEGVR